MPIKLLEAAQRLGWDIKTLHKRMEKLGIEAQTSQEDKRVKVISEADYRKLGGRIEGDNGTMGISQEIPSSVPRKALEALEPIPPSSYYVPSDSERLERIESKLDALLALLDKAVIASRYVQRKAVDDALSDLKPSRGTKIKRGNGDVPRLSEFAEAHGVNERTANDHARKGWIVVKSVPLPDGRQERYVTHEQQAGVIAFWKSIGYPFKVCPDCPHAQEVQE